MLKRIIVIWVIANFAIVGIVSLIAGQWYLSWQITPYKKMGVELGILILPNLLLAIAALHFNWLETQDSIKEELGWKWTGWRSIVVGVAAFIVLYISIRIAAGIFGESIPYNLPSTSDDSNGIIISGLDDVVKIMAIFGGLLLFIIVTVIGEESMFRGLVQTQVGKQYGAWVGIITGALLFGLRHLPNDIFYGQIWEATSAMWISRQIQLYMGAIVFGLARHIGRSTYSSAIAHGLYFFVVMFS